MRLAFIGSGAWASALALCTVRAGHEPILWCRQQQLAEALSAGKGNPVYLPDTPFKTRMDASTDMEAVLDGAELVFFVVPAQYMRATCRLVYDARARLNPDPVFVGCAKGIEIEDETGDSGRRLSEVFQARFGEDVPFACLSGPNFAKEIIHDLPAATVIAHENETVVRRVSDAVGHRRFRPYFSTDLIGVELGGALKNVLAIASGFVHGLGLGENAKAALMTRGLSEMISLVRAEGGRAETMAGLAGLGDLVLCTGNTMSRNMALGVKLAENRGRNAAAPSAASAREPLAEGALTVKALRILTRKHGIDLPICNAVYAILYEQANLDETIRTLLDRPLRYETDRPPV